MKDIQWERKLGIATAAGGFEKEGAHHSRYEPTSYAVLERLAQSGYIQKQDVLVDYGCGKGRVGFYINYAVCCETIGVEYDPKLCTLAEKNRQNYVRGSENRVHFVCESAEQYEPDGANAFYFFNPFSAAILRGVLERVFESYYANPRAMRLFFYYALDEYLTLLMTDPRLRFAGEIDCRDLFHNADEREKILIYEIE